MQQSYFPNLNSLRIFSCVADQQSFTKAANLLKMQKSTVSRCVSELEAVLKVKLIFRNTRNLELTEPGKRLFLSCKDQIANLDKSIREVFDATEKVEGLVRLSAVHDMTCTLLVPMIQEFSSVNPKIKIELVADDAVRNMVTSRLDVAVRIGKIAQTSWFARKVGKVSFIFVASPRIQTHFSSLEDLNTQELLLYEPLATNGKVRISDGKNSKTIFCDAKIKSTTTMPLLELALRGFGVSLLPDFLVKNALNQGTLVRVFGNYSAHTMPVSVVTQTSKKLPSPTTLFAKFLVEKISERLC